MGLSGIRVLDDGNVIRIISSTGSELLVHKAQVRTIDTLQDSVRIDIGEGALHHVYIKYSEVVEPLMSDLPALQTAIKNMLFQKINLVGGGGGTGGGDATAANQELQTTILRDMVTALADIKTGLALIGNNTFNNNNPLRVDESVPNIIYYGYALVGTNPDENKWAIKRVTRTADLFVYEWVNGSATFENIWDRRYTLSYQKLNQGGNF